MAKGHFQVLIKVNSRSRYYQEVAELLPQVASVTNIEINGAPFQVASVPRNSLDLLAWLRKLSMKISGDLWSGTREWEEARREVNRALIAAGYLDPQTFKEIKALPELHPDYNKVKQAINAKDYPSAVAHYYESLGSALAGPLTPELLYLKATAAIPLKARDLTYFKSFWPSTGVAVERHSEFLKIMDDLLEEQRGQGVQNMDFIFQDAAKRWLEGMTRRLKGMDYMKGELVPHLPERTWGEVCASSMPQKNRRFFPYCPDLVEACVLRAISERHRYMWVTLPPELYAQCQAMGKEMDTLEKGCGRDDKGRTIPHNLFTSGLHLSRVEIYPTRNWCTPLSYTGRTHRIKEYLFYEVDTEALDWTPQGVVGNPFYALLADNIREAENRLRDSHGLPRIGEGWQSETLLFTLVAELHPTAISHAIPDWLSPQHLDILIPDLKIAIEYQGQQHYRPVDFFGGEETFAGTVKRDERKRRLCAKQGVQLIEWRYDEAITSEKVHRVLSQVMMKKRSKLKQGRQAT